MKTRQILFSICVGLVAWLGFSHGRMTHDTVVAASPRAASVAPPVVALAEGCVANVQVSNIERVEIGSVSETFLVKWTTTSVCVQSFNVTLAIKRSDGSTRDETQKFDSNIRQGLFKLLGKRDDKLTTQATATVKASGTLAAKTNESKVLNVVTTATQGGAVGSNPTPKPTVAPTFRLSGQVRLKKEGTPVEGATISFELLNNNERKAPQPVETNAQGRWTQDQFPLGTKVRVTAFKTFLVTEPAAREATQTTTVDFVMALPDGNKPAPAAATFSVKGTAKLDSPQGQTPLAGATVTFSVFNNPNGIAQPNVPGPVTTQSDGSWPQNGFTVGVTYRAQIAKPGIVFGLGTTNFTSNTAGQLITDLGFIGTSKTPPPPPSGTFSATGDTVKKANGVISPLAGVIVSFQIANANNVPQPNLPGAVISGANGKWTQSGFSVGVLYRVTASKVGLTFPNGSPTFQSNTNGQVVQVEAMTGQGK
jgi:hypothetical protein